MSKPRLSTKPSRTVQTLKIKGKEVVVNARPDVPDFRDKMFEPTLIEVPPFRTVEVYRKKGKLPVVLDQGQEGACTGFALAAVVNYLLRSRTVNPVAKANVSPYMLYTLARRYDEWPGEDYEGSSARGAMKAWYKHGVCDGSLWKTSKGALSADIQKEAMTRPLGAYYRVDHTDIIAMHCAIAETGVLYVTASVHSGWSSVKNDGVINHEEQIIGGHAFMFVGYDEKGFWLQNSWGPTWGKNGYAHLSYDDWIENGNDAWVARLGAYMSASQTIDTSAGKVYAMSAQANIDLRPHVVTLGNNGRLKTTDVLATTPQDIKNIFKAGGSFDAITKSWLKKRIMIFAHGGLIDDTTAIEFASRTRSMFLEKQIYPVYIVWNSGLADTLSNILMDAKKNNRAQGFFDDAKNWLADRIDSLLERITAKPGNAFWSEMKENAELASEDKERDGQIGGLVHLVNEISSRKDRRSLRIHLCGHSAGSISLGPVAKRIASKSLNIASLTLWAPACTMQFFKKFYGPLIKKGTIKQTGLFVLTEKKELDDTCLGIYQKSLLYLVSRAFESGEASDSEGAKLLGMKAHHSDPEFAKLVDASLVEVVLSPNTEPASSMRASNASTHGGFAADMSGVIATTALRVASSE